MWKIKTLYWNLRIITKLGGRNKIGLLIDLLFVQISRQFDKNTNRVGGVYELRLTFKGKKFTLNVRDGADIAALHEIFVQGEYSLALNRKVSKIVDLGAHIGTTSVYFALAYPHAQIHSFEPDPENYRLLVLNTSAFVNIHCHNAAASDVSGTAIFYRSRSTLGGSLLPSDGESFTVPTVSLKDIVGDGIDILKFDIEGGEEVLFKDAKDTLERIQCAIGEVHYHLIEMSREDFSAIFQSAGFPLIVSAPTAKYRDIFFAAR